MVYRVTLNAPSVKNFDKLVCEGKKKNQKKMTNKCIRNKK